MKGNSFSYNTGYYFSTAARLLGWGATALALFQIIDGSIAAYLFLPSGVITQFTHCRTEFDLLKRTYREGVRFGTVTFGKMLHLPGIDFLYLNKNKYAGQIELRASMMRFRNVKYDGFIKLADNIKLHLVQDESKEEALKRMGKISDDLGIELRDQTEIKHY